MTQTLDWERAGRAVRQARMRKGLKQANLGVSVATVDKLENNRDTISESSIARIEQALNWPAGAIAAIAAGQPPPVDLRDALDPMPGTIAEHSQRLDELEGRLASLQETLDAIQHALGPKAVRGLRSVGVDFDPGERSADVVPVMTPAAHKGDAKKAGRRRVNRPQPEPEPEGP